MFRRLTGPPQTLITVRFEDEPVEACDGDTVAAALWAGGVEWTGARRVTGGPRAPWCMMGVCFECLVEIDGVTGQQACMVQARDGMHIRRQRRFREPGDDL